MSQKELAMIVTYTMCCADSINLVHVLYCIYGASQYVSKSVHVALNNAVHQSEGCRVLPSPHDADLLCLAAGSAVGKPLTDSASEMSTALASFTTAGSLQPKKVSLFTDCWH